ncbi:hypothetical protein P5673_003863 [Acropora cervicornis]|uniref:Uncharacterized protein n=1 Tax=Acropora cervicornis TaxID=6130 RepID=A0AAD9R1U7_ACRCE|nr:hypothetical protein P5673_003863 [Acropora cervicornis]
MALLRWLNTRESTLREQRSKSGPSFDCSLKTSFLGKFYSENQKEYQIQRSPRVDPRIALAI